MNNDNKSYDPNSGATRSYDPNSYDAKFTEVIQGIRNLSESVTGYIKNQEELTDKIHARLSKVEGSMTFLAHLWRFTQAAGAIIVMVITLKWGDIQYLFK